MNFVASGLLPFAFLGFNLLNPTGPTKGVIIKMHGVRTSAAQTHRHLF